MKLLHKLILPVVAVAGLLGATPAHADWHHRHYWHGGYGYYRPYYRHYYYRPAYYGYYSPYYYDYPYERPYYGGGITLSFGGHRWFHHHHDWR